MLTVLIVIYNKNCCDSISFKFIENFRDKINLILFDNSTRDFKNKEYCEKNNIMYYSVNENIGLSRAYNYIIDRIELNSNNYLLILDDDTILNEDYINEIFGEIEKKQYDILLPKVFSNGQLISPSTVQLGCRIKKIKDVSKVNFNQITAINSGMVIKASVYKNIKYNDEIFLDYVDHTFMKDVRKNKFKIKILMTSIDQNFSIDEKNADIKKVMTRFKLYKKDFKKYCYNNGIIGMLFYRINILKLTIRYTFEYSTLAFIKENF